jgi:hypothetical protein
MHWKWIRRERAMLLSRRMRILLKFAAVHGSTHNHFNQERALTSRDHFQGATHCCSQRVAPTLCGMIAAALGCSLRSFWFV